MSEVPASGRMPHRLEKAGTSGLPGLACFAASFKRSHWRRTMEYATGVESSDFSCAGCCDARGRSVLGERERVLVEVAAEARIEEVAVVAQREPDRIVEGALRDVVSSSESAVVTALHWPEDEDGSRDLPSAVWVCSGNSLGAVVEQVTRLDGGRTALT